MKKLLFIFTILLLTGITTKAQDLSLYYHYQHVGNGETILKYGDASSAEIVIDHLKVRNNTDKAMSIMVKREQIEMQEGTVSQFCWGLCFAPGTEVSPDPRLIMAQSTSELFEFSGHYIPDGNIGESLIRYTFFKESDPDVSVSITVKFLATPTGITNETLVKDVISDLYPNPANNSVTLDYEFTQDVTDASIKIYNLLGAEVKNAQLENSGNKIKLDISDLDKGIYFYSIYINGDTYRTKKLIVQN